MTNTTPTADQIADFLEHEAYRIRTVAAFTQRQKDFTVSIRSLACRALDVGAFERSCLHLSNGMKPDEASYMSALEEGDFTVLAVFGDETCTRSYEYHEEYSRTVALTIKNRQIELHLRVDHSPGESYAFKEWGGEESTQTFIRENPAIQGVLECLFDEYQPDFFRAESLLRKKDADMIFQKVSDCIVKQRQSNGTMRERTRVAGDDSPSP